MPLNSSPVTTTRERWHLKLEAARGKLSVDCGFYGGVVPGVRGQIGPLVGAGVLASRRFSATRGSTSFPTPPCGATSAP